MREEGSLSVRKILVPLSGRYDPDASEQLDGSALALGLAVGQAFGAHVEAFCVEAALRDTRPLLIPGVPGSEIDELIGAIEKENRKWRKQARETFDRLVEQANAPIAETPVGGIGFSAAFVEQIGDVADALAMRGRLTDLIVTAHRTIDGDELLPLMLQVALRETGRPVLVAPGEAASFAPRRVAIAWDGGAKASRAAALAAPFIEVAEQVTVISVTEGDASPRRADALADYLAWHGIDAAEIDASASPHDVGATLLAKAAEAEADLLVMGARMRTSLGRWIFGGATGAVLGHAAVPVMMAA